MKFRLIPLSQLDESCFDEWPVWSEFYEPDELEDIESWGIDPRDFRTQEQALGLGNKHAAYPVLKFDPLPDRMRIYIKARFTTPRGDVLTGYIVNDDAYAGGIFLGGDELGFNIQLSDDKLVFQEALASRLGIQLGALLPIHFQTDVRTQDGNRVAGILEL